jgi:hypothetical protein
METIALAAKEMTIYGAGSVAVTTLVAVLALAARQLISRSIGDIPATVQSEGVAQ